MTALMYPPSKNATQKILGAQLLAGVTASATLNNVDGLQNKAGVMVVDRVDTNGVETTSKREYISYTGTSGSTVVTLVRNVDGSGTDQDHAIGSVVEFIPDVIWAQAISDALANVVNTTTLALDTTKVADASSAQTLTNKTLASPNLSVGSDAVGDMYYRQAGASLARLAKGTVNQYLAMNSSLPNWQSQPNTGWVSFANSSLIALDFSTGTKFMGTIIPGSVSTTFAPTNASLSQVALLRIQYASTASLALNIFTTNATISWALTSSLPAPTAIQGKSDVFGFACVATLPSFDGFVIGQAIG
jgi:hypothetical protein